MTSDVQQWLAEIKGLQQKLVEVQQERDQAYTSAANWRNLYETEAKQRRADLQTAQASIADLKAELTQLQRPHPDASDYGAIVQQQVDQWQSIEELRTQLMQALWEADRLTQLLEAEKQAHIQTRADLTTALGDTMDLLTKARKPAATNVIPLHRSERPEPNPRELNPLELNPSEPSTIAPSPEPPLPDPAQSPS